MHLERKNLIFYRKRDYSTWGKHMENLLSLCINSRHGRTVLPGKIARPRASSLTSLFDNVIFLAELPYFLSWYYQRLSAIL